MARTGTLSRHNQGAIHLDMILLSVACALLIFVLLCFVFSCWAIRCNALHCDFMVFYFELYFVFLYLVFIFLIASLDANARIDAQQVKADCGGAVCRVATAIRRDKAFGAYVQTMAMIIKRKIARCKLFRMKRFSNEIILRVVVFWVNDLKATEKQILFGLFNAFNAFGKKGAKIREVFLFIYILVAKNFLEVTVVFLDFRTIFPQQLQQSHEVFINFIP